MRTSLGFKLVGLSVVLVLGSAPGWASAQETTPSKAAAKAKAKVKAKATTKATAKPIDLNTASLEELGELPGVGPVTAKKIVDGRPYKTLADVAKAGVPTRTLEEIKPLVTFSAPKETTPTKKAMVKTAPAKAAKPQPLVNLNTDDSDTLQELPGVGPALAKAIIAGRPYKTVDDLANVDGFGPAKIAQIKNMVTLAEPKPEPTPTPTKAAATKAIAKQKAKAKTTTPALKPGEKIDINTASLERLQELTGIGPVKAQAIIDARPFKKIEDVMTVRGIKEETFGKIKAYIVVD